MTQPWLGPLQHGELEVFARAGRTSPVRSPGSRQGCLQSLQISSPEETMQKPNLSPALTPWFLSCSGLFPFSRSENRAFEERVEQQCPSSSSDTLLCRRGSGTHEPSTAPGCDSLFLREDFFFPCFAEHDCFSGSWPSWESRYVKRDT